jgi:phage-related baseplate assembly protein
MGTIDLSTLPYPNFINADPNQILLDLISNWELQTGLTLPENGPEYQFFQTIALQLSVGAADVNFTGRQQFLGFSQQAALDNLVSNYAIERLSPTFAKCTLRWTFSQALNSPTRILAGTRIQSNDSAYIFALDEDIELEIGDTYGEGFATCTVTGDGANEYAIGTINVVVDVTNQTFIDAGTVANTDETSGGGVTETDENLRDRAIIGLESSSTAGSRASYEYWARSYSSDIVDAYAVCNTGGLATIYILEKNGTIPSGAVLAAVETFLSGDTIRPMCDTVEVLAPTKYEYEINLKVDYFPE